MDEIVKDWQDRARDFIIKTFIDSCFPCLRKNQEAWNKMRFIVILSLFSHYTKLVKGSGASAMVQYGFAQLRSFKNLASLNTLEENAITVRIAESIPILAFRKYLNQHPDEFEAQLYQNLNSVHFEAVCAGFLFEPSLTIHLAELLNEKICKGHVLFKDIDNINKLDLLLSCKTTIRNLDNCNATTLCSGGSMKEKDGHTNLPSFLKNPTTAFFKPEKEAGPDLVCIVEVHTPNGIVEIPLFLQAKLVINSPAKKTTDPYKFYLHRNKQTHRNKRTGLKKKLRDDTLDCLKSKYCKAEELSWIRFLVVFPAKANAESKYIIKDEDNKESRPKRKAASKNYKVSKANELFIVIDPFNAKHFFSKFGLEVLEELKHIAYNDDLELESKEDDEMESEEDDEMELD